MVKRIKRVNFIILIFLCGLLLSIPVVFAAQLNLTYDGNGNLITGDGKYREYNGFNQLIRVREGNSASGNILETYVYDPTGDKIFAKYTDYGGFNDPDGATVYVNDNFERGYTNLKGTQKVNDTYYVRDENGIVGELKTNGTISKKLYYNPDHLGSTSLITNQSGGIVEETFYDPYGEILSGGAISRYQYEGKEFSQVTEDYDFHFRKYNPSLGIFTQPEQAFPNIYDPQQLNRYSFERRNPYKYVDPNGKEIVLATIAGVAITYTMIETAIDVASLLYSTYSFAKDPHSAINTAALILDITDLLSGPFSNPGPSGAIVHGGEALLKHAEEAAAKQVGAHVLHEVEKNYFMNQNNYNGLSLVSAFSGNSYLRYNKINSIQQSSSNIKFGVYCEVYGCYSVKIPPQTSTGGSSGSNTKDNKKKSGERPSDEYCNTHSDRRC